MDYVWNTSMHSLYLTFNFTHTESSVSNIFWYDANIKISYGKQMSSKDRSADSCQAGIFTIIPSGNWRTFHCIMSRVYVYGYYVTFCFSRYLWLIKLFKPIKTPEVYQITGIIYHQVEHSPVLICLCFTPIHRKQKQKQKTITSPLLSIRHLTMV